MFPRKDEEIQKRGGFGSYLGAAGKGALAGMALGTGMLPGAIAGIAGNYMRRRTDPGQMPQELENAGNAAYQGQIAQATGGPPPPPQAQSQSGPPPMQRIGGALGGLATGMQQPQPQQGPPPRPSMANAEVPGGGPAYEEALRRATSYTRR